MIFENYPSSEGSEKLDTSNLHELLMIKLMELYQGEMRLLEELNRLQEACCTALTQKIITQYQRNKGDQVERLQQVFVLLDFPITGRSSRITEVMLEECRNLTFAGSNAVNDFAIGHLIMMISHYNQAAYEWLFSLATKLQMLEIKEFLKENFNQEKEIDFKIIMAVAE